jgi:orotidine-5'-phosphate decarboxylase
MGVKILTVQGDPHIVEAAAKAKQDSGRNDFSIFAVTVLTSLDENDLQKMLYTIPVSELVLQRAKYASDAGADGVIASGHEVKSIKQLLPHLKVITPGIRSHTQNNHDQKRVMSPLEALNAGADHLVIGRQITNAPSPTLEAKNILLEISKI